ncbi:MAG: sigma-54-dependent Fis family transcriptional regulator [Desulfovibrio sp.]|nr:MAG: sigma-54-dependent Fis family transcriptional regulator [Desulfovibrio sp.]
MRILIVDDNANSLQGLNVVLEDLGHETTAMQDPVKAWKLSQQTHYPLIITDIRMPVLNGLELLGRIKGSQYSSDCDVVIVTGHGDMETAIEALRKGAYDYLNKPINARELAAVVERCAEHQALIMENKQFRDRFAAKVDEAARDVKQDLEQVRERLREVAGIGSVIAQSPAMTALLQETKMYHNDPDVPVLIEGETGTGKEILARLVHFGDGGTDSPFVAINCSAIPERLFESELMGHEPGAYTGSTRRGAPGKLEIAASGTLFLDEIAEMPLDMQPKLLRVLEDKTFYRVGGVKKRRFLARVICAANRDLETLVDKGLFRRDLFHRLNVGRMFIPPLRERTEDIAPLAEHFLVREAQKKKKGFTSLSQAAIDLFLSLPWPGNVRELENAIERAVLTCDGQTLHPAHMGFLLAKTSSAQELPQPPPFSLETMQLPESSLPLESLTQAIVRRALNKFGGNKTKTAKYLGISRYALHRRLEKKE